MSTKEHLAIALDAAEDDRVRFHIRQALQLQLADEVLSESFRAGSEEPG